MIFFKKKAYTVLVLLFFLLTCCKHDKDRFINTIINTYSVDEINHFSELCFNEGGDKAPLKKWHKNIFVRFEGDTLAGDRNIVLKIISTINALNLPISIAEATARDKYNFRIISGDDKLRGLHRPNRAVTNVYAPYDIIDSAELKISNRIQGKKRSAFFWHEVLHALGFSSHITTDSKSISFAVCDSTMSITNKEIAALKILYESKWPKGYTSKDFDREFSLVLYHVSGKHFILNFSRENETDSSALREILQHGLIQPAQAKEPEIFKHVNYLKVAINGDTPVGLADTVHVIIDAINQATPNLQMALTRDSAINYGIVLNFTRNIELSKNNVAVDYLNWINSESKFKTINRTDATIQTTPLLSLNLH